MAKVKEYSRKDERKLEKALEEFLRGKNPNHPALKKVYPSTYAAIGAYGKAISAIERRKRRAQVSQQKLPRRKVPRITPKTPRLRR